MKIPSTLHRNKYMINATVKYIKYSFTLTKQSNLKHNGLKAEIWMLNNNA